VVELKDRMSRQLITVVVTTYILSKLDISHRQHPSSPDSWHAATDVDTTGSVGEEFLLRAFDKRAGAARDANPTRPRDAREFRLLSVSSLIGRSKAWGWSTELEIAIGIALHHQPELFAFMYEQHAPRMYQTHFRCHDDPESAHSDIRPLCYDARPNP
jgi:hypothetical protein